MDSLLEIENKSEYTMDSNLQRRIRNFTLSPDKFLMPLFEAISNSIHAIQDRYGDKWLKKGRVEVQFIRSSDDKIKEILVTDNGIGLNDHNFDSFLKTDSEYKKNRGGKGIGRFSWLKVFNDIKITSSFTKNNKFWTREFNFGIKDAPVYNHILVENGSQTGTKLKLSGIKDTFSNSIYANVSLDRIVKETISHFISTLVSGVPDILFVENDIELNIREEWKSFIVDTKTEELDQILGLTITHLMLKKGLLDKNTLFLTANNRSVETKDIGTMLGLKTAILFQPDNQNDAELCYYVGVLSGELFDRAAYGERTGLNIDHDLLNQIMNKTRDLLKAGYLKQFYTRAIKDKEKVLQSILQDNPRFSYLVKDISEFTKNMNISSTTKLEVYRDLAVKDFNENLSLEEQKQDIIANTNNDTIESIEDITSKLTKRNQGVLAEYIYKRSSVLDLLDRSRGFKDPKTQEKFLEKDIHNIICPMQVDSDMIDIKEHNLWVIDDRLAYYDYLASDKTITSYLEGSDSKDRPDIALFNGCNAFSTENTNQPVVIIEFKKPERNDYTNDENPLTQVLTYISEFRNQKVRKKGGQLITTINEHTPFQCYIICDITQKMREFMALYGGFDLYPDKHGYRSYRKDFNAMIDVISFENLIADAKLRNEIFFDKLGLLKK